MYTDWNRGGQVEQASGRPPRSKAERLVEVSALDGRSSPSVAYLQLTPWRVQAWWSPAGAGHADHHARRSLAGLTWRVSNGVDATFVDCG